MIRIPPKPDRWDVWIPLETDLKGIKPSHCKMALILERLFRGNPDTWPSNATLAVRYDCTTRQARTIIREMEAAGFITRVPVDDGNPRAGRLGIVAHSRLDPHRPAVQRPPSPEDKDRLKGRRMAEENFLPPRKKTSYPPRKKTSGTRNKESLSLKKDELEESGGSLDQRQRKDNPTLTASPVVPAPESPAAAPAPAKVPALVATELPRAEALTPGQEAFLATLDAGQRAKFDSLNVAKRTALLKPHAVAFVPEIAGFQIRTELPAIRPVEDIPSLPRTMAELLEQLPGKPRAWASQAAELLAQGLEDRRFWGEFHKIAEEIRAGTIDPAPAINAYHQAMKPKIVKRGAKFWAAFKGLTGLNEMAASL
jgi:hypothetical protein